MSDAQFQTEFNNILQSDTALKAELDKAKVTHMGTNILLKMKQKCARKDLVSQVSNNLENRANSLIKTAIKEKIFN